ncbi:MAG: mercury methylation corrinoid protein HgcA, partial [Coriobacteriia bacterium]|nr:mercury methylation corrinoid protein HgcA [Coriobacteriia bacterium]
MIGTVGTELTMADRFGALRMRLDIGRGGYRVQPGLYQIGSPSPDSPVLVTSNYKLTFDHVRSQMVGHDVWLLVVDTGGINVWCAAGKGTFGSVGVARSIVESGLANVVGHRTVILPQLGATGVAAHEIKAFTGFRVVFGPVRASDIPAFLKAGMRVTPEMRTVTFTLAERLTLTGVELSVGWKPKTLLGMALFVLLSGIGIWGFSTDALIARGTAGLLAAYTGLASGALIMPALLPALPFRLFAAKGVLVGAVTASAVAWLVAPAIGSLAAAGLWCASVAIASYVAMNFTGSSPIASPSGVEAEMRKALPWQGGGAALAI